jgi:hypothetical protein
MKRTIVTLTLVRFFILNYFAFLMSKHLIFYGVKNLDER